MTAMAMVQHTHSEELHYATELQFESYDTRWLGGTALLGIKNADVLRVLARRPIREVSFQSFVVLNGRPAPDVDGTYDPGYVRVKMPRTTLAQGGQRDDYGREVGQHLTVSQLASDHQEAVTRTLLHEVAHHLQADLREKAALLEEFVGLWNAAQARKQTVSEYAMDGNTDYWAELVVAALAEPRVHELDPDGMAFVERALPQL